MGRENTIASKDLTVHPEDDQQYKIDLTTPLYGRTISSVDSYSVDPSGSLTVASEGVSGSYTDDDDGSTVAENKAIEFNASGGTDKTDYMLTFVCSLSDGSTMGVNQRIRCRSGAP